MKRVNCIVTIRHSSQAAQAWAEGNVLCPNLLTTGWLRVLPPRLFRLFHAIVWVAAQGLNGESMWAEVRRIQAPPRGGAPEPDSSLQDRLFERSYGNALPDSVDALVGILVDLGLVVRTEENGYDVLDVPLQVPVAADRLNLSRRERIMQAAIRYRLPIHRAESAVLDILAEHDDEGPLRTTLDRLATLTEYPLTLLREALASLLEQGDVSISRPLPTLRDDARFVLTANWVVSTSTVGRSPLGNKTGPPPKGPLLCPMRSGDLCVALC